MQKRFQHAPEPESDIKTGRMIDENETIKVWIETCADETKKDPIQKRQNVLPMTFLS
jgi:hypothetical protein